MPDFFSLETTRYQTWENDFRLRLGNLVEAVAKHISPVTERRLGIRYVDRLVRPDVTAPTKWKGYVAPELLGLVAHKQLGNAVTGAQQQVDLNLGEGRRCILRHGIYLDADGKVPYVMDFDVYREQLQPFSASAIRDEADDLSLWALRLFQLAITERLMELLKSGK